MPKSLKYSLYLFLFGLLTIYAVFVRDLFKKTYTPGEIQGAATNLELFIEPEIEKSPLLNKIYLAKKEILVEVYLLSDKEIISALKDANSRGVATKIILEKNPYGPGSLNKKTFDDLESNRVSIKWSNQYFALTHAKIMIFDNQILCVLNQNLTTTAFTKNREYNVCTEDSTDVTEAKNIFTADWNRTNFSPTTTNLVISPDTARGKISALINSAQKSLDIEIEILEDKEMIDLITSKAQTIPVRLIIPPLKKISTNQKPPGTTIKELSNPYPHAKLIIADELKAYLGSVNLSSASLDQNREIGIIISQNDVVDRLQNQFNQDWQNSPTIP